MNRIHTILLAGVFSCVLFSCNKSTTGSGPFMVVHASPGLGSVELFMDNTPFTTSALAYTSNTGYQPLTEGRHLLKVAAPGNTNSIFEITLTTAAEVSQSLFFFNRPSALDVFAVEDRFIAPGSGKAGLRFFHLSPSSPVVDLGAVSGTVFTPLFTARSFETTTSAPSNAVFKTVNSGNYSLQLRVSGAGTELLTVNTVVLQEGKCYTLFAKGIAGNTETPLGIELITHN